MRSRNRHGGTLIYCLIMMTAMFGIASFAVDFGRVELVKTELQRCADAAARAAANELNSTSSLANLQAAAQQYASANLVDGGTITLDTTNDIETGTWDSVNKVFTPAAFSSSTAVRITARKTAARGTAVPLTFAKVVGQNTCDVTAVSIVQVAAQAAFVHGNYNPYRAGNSGSAPGHDPAKFAGKLNAGDKFSFNNLINAASLYGADGNTNNILTLPAQNGISGIQAPQGALVGVFLDDNDPSQYTAPASLDFSTNGKRNFTTVSPLLRQLFFIGDGARVSPNDQYIVVPSGATRLYFGVVDSSWLTDWGTITVSPLDTSSGGGNISVVK